MALTDANESVVERYEYDAYGALTVLDADGSADSDGISDVGNAYTFAGRRLDDESGLMQYRNRWYSPVLGRFLSRDPAGYADAYDLYLYATDRPTFASDPMGTVTWVVARETRFVTGREYHSAPLMEAGRTADIAGSILSGILAGGGSPQYARREAERFRQRMRRGIDVSVVVQGVVRTFVPEGGVGMCRTGPCGAVPTGVVSLRIRTLQDDGDDTDVFLCKRACDILGAIMSALPGDVEACKIMCEWAGELDDPCHTPETIAHCITCRSRSKAGFLLRCRKCCTKAAEDTWEMSKCGQICREFWDEIEARRGN